MNRKSMVLGSLIITAPMVSLLLFGFSNGNFAQVNDKKISQPSLSQSQISHIQNHIEDITTPNGVYIRTNHVVELPANEIAYNNDESTKYGIEEIILPYGTFVKTTLYGLKSFQEQWQKTHSN